MTRYRNTIWCDGCGVEILWVPLQVGNLHYCCEDCKAGYRCECSTLEDENQGHEQEAKTPQYTYYTA